MFGWTAVTRMLISYGLEDRSRWFTLALPEHAFWRRRTGFFKAPGDSGWWKLSDHWLAGSRVAAQ